MLPDWFTQNGALGNTWLQWSSALLLTLAAFFALGLARRIIRKILEKRSKLQAQYEKILCLLAKLVDGTRIWVLFLLALYIGSRVLSISESLDELIQKLALILLLVQVGLWISSAIVYWTTAYKDENLETDPARVTVVTAIGFLSQLAIFTIIFLTALATMGAQIGPMIASLGVAGIAVGLALQNVLGDLFASLAIVFDQPFVMGDFIVVGDMMGTVEKVGLKTTRLRSLSGEQLVFGNSDLLSSRIRNYKRMKERRVVFGFGVIYSTPVEKLEQIPEWVREIIDEEENARFDRAHFFSYGDSDLKFEVVYYVLLPDYPTYMDVQQAINLGLKRKFEDAGVEFAYPTQTIYIANGGEEEKSAVNPGIA